MKRVFIFISAVMLTFSCSKFSDEPGVPSAEELDNQVQLATSAEIAQDLRDYIAERKNHYAAHPPSNVSLSNTVNPYNQVGERHNFILDEAIDNNQSFLSSTASFTVSDCYPSTCAAVTLDAEHRPYYLVLEIAHDEYGSTPVLDMQDRDAMLDMVESYHDYIDANWDPNASSYSESEYAAMLSHMGIPGLRNTLLAITLSELNTVSNIDLYVALAKDVESHVATSADISETDKDMLLPTVSTMKYSGARWLAVPPNTWPIVWTIVADVVGAAAGTAYGILDDETTIGEGALGGGALSSLLVAQILGLT